LSRKKKEKLACTCIAVNSLDVARFRNCAHGSVKTFLCRFVRRRVGGGFVENER